MVSSYSAYQRTNTATENPRALEYRLLGMVTAAMIDAEKKNEPYLRPARVDAALWNKQVWDHLLLDLVHEENRLPKETRVALVNVGVWVTKEVRSVTDNQSDCSALIEINQIIMQGLKASAIEAAPADSSPVDPSTMARTSVSS